MWYDPCNIPQTIDATIFITALAACSQGFIKHVVYGWLCMYCMVIFSIRMQCMVYLFPYMYGLRMACMTYIFRHTCMDYRHVFLICLTTVRHFL